MAEQFSAIRSFVLNTSSYTPITCPGQYNYYEIIGTSDGSAMIRSSDGTDAHSYPFGQNSWYSFGAPSSPYLTQPRFSPYLNVGTVVTYLKAVQGTPTVYVEFMQ
jgi:hypothetical protein